MLDKRIVKKFNLEDCRQEREIIEPAIALTEIRLERLRTTAERDPGWQSFDKYADDMVGIDIRIEEQHACLEMLEEELQLITEREETLKIEGFDYPSYVTTKKQKQQHYAFEMECQENVAKGLTFTGFTKTFEGESRTFYLNNIEITCKVDYDISSPHLEFKGEPNLITSTGYFSHFVQVDLKEFATMEEMIEYMVAGLMNEKRNGKKPKEYTLTWEPSLEYLSHSPVQLDFFDVIRKEKVA